MSPIPKLRQDGLARLESSGTHFRALIYPRSLTTHLAATTQHVLVSESRRVGARTEPRPRELPYTVGKSKTVQPAEPKPFVPLLDYQRRDVECTARFRWNCWARQTGKSFTKSLRRILRGLERGRTQIFLSAGERQSRELMAKARQHCQALKIANDYYDTRLFKNLSIKQLEIVLPRGGTGPLASAGFVVRESAESMAYQRLEQTRWRAHHRPAGQSADCPWLYRRRLPRRVRDAHV